MGTKKGLLTGALSGAASGAAAGSVIPGWGTAVGAGVGALAAALSGSADDADTDYERNLLEEEKRRKEMESGFSHLMTLREAGQTDRSQSLSGLSFLASSRLNAETNARRRLLRNSILNG
jgi:phage tail tape-measure protein